MKKTRFALSVTLASASLLAVWACSGGGDNGPPAASADAAPDARPADARIDTYLPIVGDESVPTAACTLDTGNDPVSLCVQKQALQEQARHGYVASVGMYASWASTPPYGPDPGDGGAPLHDVRDDLAYVSTLAAYLSAAEVYGDTELTATADAQLTSLTKVILTELSVPPADYDGDIYFHLRGLSGGLRTLGDTDDAAKIDAIADAYGRTIYEQYVQPVTLPAGPADAGVDAAGDGGSDGGGGATMSSTIGVLQKDGSVAYQPALVATAAYALLHMAKVHYGVDPNAAKWENAALAALDYIALRAEDPSTGLYFAQLHTSADTGHDALDPSPGGVYPSDALLSDVQATIALALYRASALAVGASGDGGALAGPASGYPFGPRATAVLASLNGESSPVTLWDGVPAGDAGPGNDAGVGSGTGYLEGWVPSTASYLTNKTTRANARLYAAIRHGEVDIVGSSFAWQLPLLRLVLGGILAQDITQGSNLYTVVPDQTGYVRAGSKTFGLAILPGGTTPEPRASSYRAQAIDDACEGLDEFWYGYHP